MPKNNEEPKRLVIKRRMPPKYEEDEKKGSLDYKENLMKLDIENGKVIIEGVEFYIDKIAKVELIDFSWKKLKMKFLYLDNGDDYFMYNDSESYDELLKTIAEDRTGVAEKLLQLQSDYGIEHQLWGKMVRHSFQKYNISANRFYWDFFMNSLVTIPNDDIEKRYGEIFPQKISDLHEAYVLLSSVLPQNFSTTRRNHLRQKFEDEYKELTDICGNNFENRENYLEKLEMRNGSSVVRWNASMKDLQSLRAKLQGLIQEGIFDNISSSNIQLFLDDCINYVGERVDKLNENALLQQYGPISDLKIRLRENINRLKFAELHDWYYEYKEKERELCAKARQEKKNLNEYPYGDYIDIYRLGKILISDKMNQINRNKANNKYIPQELLEEALIFYYDTESAKEADSIRSNEKYAQDKQSGNKGEQLVDYALKWLDASYIVLEKRSRDRVGNSCIYIVNPDYIDVKQEFDHLVVSNKGIFNIETKNYTGKLVVDQYGNWKRMKDNEEEGLKNPLQQIRQHEKILTSFLPEDCKIISIICIANNKAIIEGVEHCPIPIVKSDMLVEFIENYDESELNISDAQKELIVNEIYEHIVE